MNPIKPQWTVEKAMDNLITALKQATEGSRELDARIEVAITSKEVLGEEYKDCRYEFIEWCGRDDGWAKVRIAPPEPSYDPWTERWDCNLHYTTSLDAALTLVPEGWEPGMLSWSIPDLTEDGKSVRASVVSVNEKGIPKGGHNVGWATIPALALCIAALRARQGSEP